LIERCGEPGAALARLALSDGRRFVISEDVEVEIMTGAAAILALVLDHPSPRRQRRIQRSRPARVAKFPVNCELPHVGAPKNMRALFRQAQRDAEGMQMRIAIGIAVVVAIGLIWSVAVMSELIPVVSAG
jgi:hypothetical protein